MNETEPVSKCQLENGAIVHYDAASRQYNEPLYEAFFMRIGRGVIFSIDDELMNDDRLYWFWIRK